MKEGSRKSISLEFYKIRTGLTQELPEIVAVIFGTVLLSVVAWGDDRHLVTVDGVLSPC